MYRTGVCRFICLDKVEIHFPSLCLISHYLLRNTTILGVMHRSIDDVYIQHENSSPVRIVRHIARARCNSLCYDLYLDEYKYLPSPCVAPS